MIMRDLPFSKYCSKPRRRASNCCGDNLNGHFDGKELNVKSGNSCFNCRCNISNSRNRLEHRCRPR